MAFPAVGSIFESVPESAFETQTNFPPDATARPLGPSPTVTMPTTRFFAGSIRDTVASWLLATQTAPGPAATAAGALPTLIGVTLPDAGSRRASTPADLPVTHTAPSPTA